MTSEEIFQDIQEEIDFENDVLGQQLLESEPSETVDVTTEPPDQNEDNLEPEETATTVNNNNEKDKQQDKSNENRLSKLPLARVKNLMKLDPDLQMASTEAVFLITKATELFIDSLAKECFTHTVQSKKKVIQKRDIDMAIASVDSLMFLEGAMNF